jgi:hypothetical protein
MKNETKLIFFLLSFSACSVNDNPLAGLYSMTKIGDFPLPFVFKQLEFENIVCDSIDEGFILIGEDNKFQSVFTTHLENCSDPQKNGNVNSSIVTGDIFQLEDESQFFILVNGDVGGVPSEGFSCVFDFDLEVLSCADGLNDDTSFEGLRVD